MKIAVEIPYYALGARGSATYGDNLIKSFARVATEHRFQVFNYFWRDYDLHLARLSHLAAPNVELAIQKWPQRLVDLAERKLGYRFVQQHYLESSGVDVFHDGGWHPIEGAKAAQVTTFHGAASSHFGIDPTFESAILPNLLKARRVIADSACIRDMLLKYYPFAPETVVLVYLGVDHARFRPIDDKARLEAARERYRLPEEYLLCVGPFQFRDNIELVLQAFAKNKGRLKDISLVLAGGPEEHGAQLRAQVMRLGLEKKVVFTGHVSHDDLPSLYNLATAYLHPSIHEEFGLQLLEAAASGAPILSSNAGGLPESAGPGAAYFNPHQTSDFEATLFRVLDSASLSSELRERGMAHAAGFSWDRTARETIEVYKDALL